VKRKKKKGSPLGGERLLPAGRFDPLELLRFEAQSHFLDAVAEHCPHVLDFLWSEVFEVERAGVPNQGVREKKAAELLNRCNVGIVKRTGRDRLGCRICSTWFSHAVVGTVGEWWSPAFSEKPQKLKFFFGAPNYHPEERTPRKPRYYRDEVLRPTPLPETIVGLRWDPHLESLLGAQRFSFEFSAFEPFEQRAADWKRLCKAAFERSLEAHLAERDPGGPKTPRMTEPDHFRWAALAVFGENGDGTFGWTYEQIRKTAGKDTVSAIQTGVQNVLQLIGIEAKRTRGRRAGVKEKKVRIRLGGQ
jgi:hypothetical protein